VAGTGNSCLPLAIENRPKLTAQATMWIFEPASRFFYSSVPGSLNRLQGMKTEAERLLIHGNYYLNLGKLASIRSCSRPGSPRFRKLSTSLIA